MGWLGSLFSLEGRTNRLGWWGRQLLILVWWFSFIAVFAAIYGDKADLTPYVSSILIFWAVAFFGSVALNLPATVRRYHDRGKSGLWFLVVFIPVIGPIWALIELGCLPGEKRDNAYGPSLTKFGDAFEKAFSEAVMRHATAGDAASM